MSYNRYNSRKRPVHAGPYNGGSTHLRHRPYSDRESIPQYSSSLKYSDSRSHNAHDYSHRPSYRSPMESSRGFFPSSRESDTALTTPTQSPHLGQGPEGKEKQQDFGTNAQTGVNGGDSKYDLQMHHKSYMSSRPLLSRIDLLKNYRVTYDPELDKLLLKADRKKKHRKLRFQTESGDQSALDPRLKIGLSAYLSKPNKALKKMPFKHLPQPRFVYDKNSLGAPPQLELVIWDLPITVSEVYLVNFFESFGESVKDMKFINDPVNAVPLGIATFSFPGSPEKALRLARKLLKTVKLESPKIDGVDLKIALNDFEGKLVRSKIEVAQEKLRVARTKREQEEKLLKAQTKKAEPVPEPAEEPKKEPEAKLKFEHVLNTTKLSIRHHSKIIKGVFLPEDLVKYVKDRPFIYINDKYVPTRKISSQDIKKVLMKYDWTRVLVDKTGFFVVFNTYKECERCFNNEDGVRFFEYKLYMELCVPEKFVGDENVKLSKSGSKGHDVVDEAANMLIKEFQQYLSKDIRERIIAPTILDALRAENYPELMKEMKAKEQEREKQREEEKQKLTQKDPEDKSLSKNGVYSFLVERKTDIKANNHVLLLPSFTKKLGVANGKRKKKMFPMQHALNYDDHESDESDEEETSRSATPAPLKRELVSTPEVESPAKRQKTSKLRETLLYDTSDEEMEASTETGLTDIGEGEVKPTVDLKYELTTNEEPELVYEEIIPQAGLVFDLQRLQELLKDEEDLALARKVLADIKPSSIGHLGYWAWKQRQQASSTIMSEEENMGILSDHLECQTGSFKSEGHRKINDADKVEYLPHRRKIHKPLKTVQHDAEEHAALGTHSGNNVQSSRVNRANNRRFAADISAQKQILSSESDILNLNALTKRKKPVSFARSAIHNWGLYALEPIAAKEMIIEYVGESIRQQVAEHREKSYLRTGIGSSYLFRIDENTVIDATKKGGIARFINHCCNPSCTAKIIKVDGMKRIVIYALRDIDANEELTYDYKFERETNDAERIRCLCGAPGCKGYLN